MQLYFTADHWVVTALKELQQSRQEPSPESLTLPRLRKKSYIIFFFTLLCGVPKYFMNVLTAFIKFFGVPQRSVKIS